MYDLNSGGRGLAGSPYHGTTYLSIFHFNHYKQSIDTMEEQSSLNLLVALMEDNPSPEDTEDDQNSSSSATPESHQDSPPANSGGHSLHSQPSQNMKKETELANYMRITNSTSEPSPRELDPKVQQNSTTGKFKSTRNFHRQSTNARKSH